jgi:hypothetical protein
VKGLPTSFGKVSYSLVRRGSTIDARLVLPPGCHCQLRLRVPAGQRVVSATVGGTRIAVNRSGTIVLGTRHGVLELRASVR